MTLEVGNFPVTDVVLGGRTRWADGVLEIDKRELLDLVMDDPAVAWADIEVARPAESARIIRIRDIIEPKIKVEGPGVTYPGIAGRPVAIVGRGKTHRLGGMTIMPCSEMPERNADGTRWWAQTDVTFVDMSGPGAVTPFAGTVNLCLAMEPTASAFAEDWNRVLQAAMLKVNDRVARATLGLDAPQTRVYDLDRRDASLPTVVFVPVLASAEYRFGPRTSLGTGVYGIGRLTQPWLLDPTELLDGAVCGTYNENFTWPILETLVPRLCAGHGIDFNFAGCIVVRSNWEAQAEKELMADRAARLALAVGAQGAIVTTNVRGQRFVETILTVQALERAGVKTILMTEEEDNEDGTAPPLLVPAPEVVAVVSTGTGGVDATFPGVARVIGTQKPAPHWYAERSPIHGRYGVSHLHDYYGAGRQGCLDF
jgi:glycine reductase complex component B subunit alpha and beta